MTFENFYKQCEQAGLCRNYRYNEHTCRVNYNFYLKLGYTHAQSLFLSICGLNNPSAWNAIFNKTDKMREKNSNIPYFEFIEENLEEIYKDVQDKWLTQQLYTRSASLGNSKSAVKKSKGAHSPNMLSKSMLCLNNTIDSFDGNCFAPVGLSMDSSLFPKPGLSMGSPELTEPELLLKSVFLDNSNRADAESYAHIEEKNFQNVAESPTSSFRTTCNTASMGLLLNQVRHGAVVKPSSIRTEELMNSFNYDLKDNGDLINLTVEMCDKPYSKNKLLFIGAQGKIIIPDKQNIVLLLDVSGSMSSNNYNMVKTIAAIIKKLNIGDTLSLITYSSIDHTIMDSIVFDGNVDKIIKKLFEIEITGYTNGSAGIETAYKIAAKNYIKGGANKVILITDGDLNFGINSNDGLKELILEKKKTGVFLSVIGMGIGNFKDDKLETLAKNGNGNYCVINEEFEVETEIVQKYDKLIFSIAKDVKAQVEFNPALIKSYRLLGYENREISHSDFNNDAVIAEPFGSGATCVALYEIEPADGTEIDSGLKYQKTVLTDNKEYCTAYIRYKLPLEDESKLISKSINNIGEMTPRIKLAYICYAIAEKFRKSTFSDLKDELFARYLAETIEGKIAELNKDKIELLKYLAAANAK